LGFVNNYNIICITIVMYYILQSFKYRCTDSLKLADSADIYRSKQKTILLCILEVHMLFYNEQFTYVVNPWNTLYCAVNTFHRSYKNQSVYVIERKSHRLFQDKYNTHKCNVGTI